VVTGEEEVGSRRRGGGRAEGEHNIGPIVFPASMLVPCHPIKPMLFCTNPNPPPGTSDTPDRNLTDQAPSHHTNQLRKTTHLPGPHPRSPSLTTLTGRPVPQEPRPRPTYDKTVHTVRNNAYTEKR